MLKITPITGHDGIPTFKLEGKLLEPWVEELARICGSSASGSGTPHLDLTAVTFVDAAGIQLLYDLRARGVIFDACSGFITALFQGDCT